MPADGVYTVAPTPFDEDGAIDFDSIDRLTERVLESGADGLLVLGVMGEAHKLLDVEREAVLERFISATNGRAPVIAGINHPSAIGAREYAKRAEATGSSAVMVAPPPLPKPNPSAVIDYFRAVADGCDLEIVIQDHPASSGVFLPVELLADLCEEIPQARAVKLEDPPTPPKIGALLERVSRVSVFGGLGGFSLLEELDRGASGAMTGFAFPEVLGAIFRHHREGDVARAREVFNEHLPLIRFEAQPFISLAVRKRIYQLRGAISHDLLREPAPVLDEGTAAELEALLNGMPEAWMRFE